MSGRPHDVASEHAVPVEILPGWTRVLPFRVDVEQPFVTRPPGEPGLGGT